MVAGIVQRRAKVMDHICQCARWPASTSTGRLGVWVWVLVPFLLLLGCGWVRVESGPTGLTREVEWPPAFEQPGARGSAEREGGRVHTATSATAKDSPAMVTERSVGSAWRVLPWPCGAFTATSPSVGLSSANSGSPWYTSNTSCRFTRPVKHAIY